MAACFEDADMPTGARAKRDASVIAAGEATEGDWSSTDHCG